MISIRKSPKEQLTKGTSFAKSRKQGLNLGGHSRKDKKKNDFERKMLKNSESPAEERDAFIHLELYNKSHL